MIEISQTREKRDVELSDKVVVLAAALDYEIEVSFVIIENQDNSKIVIQENSRTRIKEFEVWRRIEVKARQSCTTLTI